MGDDDRRSAQRARLRLIGDIVAALAHDFGQPLNIIRLSAENGLDICDDAAADEDDGRRRIYVMIGEQAARLQSTMDRLVSVARGTQGARTIHLAAAIDEVLDDLRPRCAAEQVAVDWQPPVAGPAVHGVPEQLRLVLDTLLSNAFEAVLSARMSRPAPGIRIACGRRNGHVVITVSDDGTGMPDGVIDGVRDPLVAPDRLGRRAGIGLMLSAGIVAEMAGRLAIDATPQGTCVTVVLPAACPT